MIKFFQIIKAPTLMLFSIVLIEILAIYKIIPTIQELGDILRGLLVEYGVLIVGPLAFLENIVGFNVYFPGSTIILATMGFTAGDPAKAILTYLIYSIFAITANHVNFLLGSIISKKSAVFNKTPKGRAERTRKWIRFITTFWHPHLAALTCYHVGSEGYKYSEIVVYLLVASFIWNTFWGISMYYIGFLAGTNINLNGIVYGYLGIWIILSIYRFISAESKKNKSGFHP